MGAVSPGMTKFYDGSIDYDIALQHYTGQTNAVAAMLKNDPDIKMHTMIVDSVLHVCCNYLSWAAFIVT